MHLKLYAVCVCMWFVWFVWFLTKEAVKKQTFFACQFIGFFFSLFQREEVKNKNKSRT